MPCQGPDGKLTAVIGFAGTTISIQAYLGDMAYNHVGENAINLYQQEHDELFPSIKACEHRFTDFQRATNSTLTAILGRMPSYSGQKITSKGPGIKFRICT